jgi:hypothetical protein
VCVRVRACVRARACVCVSLPVPMAELFKSRVCGRLLAGIAGSNPTGDINVSCECRVFAARGLCDVLIPRSEECYRLACVIVCDLETSRMRRPWRALGCCAREKITQGHYIAWELVTL